MISKPVLMPSLRGGATASGPPIPAGGGGRRFKVEHRIGVQAPAEVVWEIIADLASWPAWNPLYTSAEGEIRIGATLTLTVAMPGEPAQAIQPQVLDWVPSEQLLWRTSAHHGLVKSVRYVEIEQLSETGSVLSNGELFGGMLGPMLARRRRRALREGFTLMGEALAARAEAIWRERAPAPTSRP